MTAALAVSTNTASADDARIAKVIAFARRQLGKPYVFGSAGPNTWDCSGLVMRAYQTIGVHLAHSTYIIVTQGRAVPPRLSAMQPGDLILPHPGHVQLYIGGGKVIEAYDTGYPVKISPVSRMWRVRRMVGDGVTVAGGTGGTDSGASNFSGADTAKSSGGLSIDGLGQAVSWITTAHNWLRIGEFLGGLILLYVAILAAIKAGKVT